MVEVTPQYMEFLKANYSGIATRLETLLGENPAGSTPDEITKSKAKIEEEIRQLANDSERTHKYGIWQKVPPILRDRYHGQVPAEVMEAAERDEIQTLRIMEYHPEVKQVQQARQIAEEEQTKVSTAVAGTAAAVVLASALAAGYSKSASAELANQRLARDTLLASKAANPNMSEAEKDLWMRAWLQTRQDTVDTIKKDWRETQPEKLLINLLGKFNTGKIGKEELLPQVADLIQQINTDGRQGNLLEYLKTKPIQAKIGHFNEDTLSILANSVLTKFPDAERAQLMNQAPALSRGDAALQAQMLSDSMLSAKANTIPEREAAVSPQDRYANMPSVLNRGNQRDA